MSYRVSVVVPTYKRPEMLACCLNALAQQDIDPASYEVIVVDDAACEETRRQVEGLARRFMNACGPSLRYVAVQGKHGPAVARNTGWRVAQGEIIAFTDDDCIPQPYWLRMGTAAFVEGVTGVSGKVIVPLPEMPTDYERNAARLAYSEFVTANCFYRRSALEAVGGFDERFTMAWREDSDLFFRLLKEGGKLLSVPEAVVVHPVRPARWGISLSQQRKSMFNALLYKKHPLLYQRRIQAHPPWHYYGIVASALLAVSGWMLGAQSFALGAALAWVLLMGWFCQLRLRHTSHLPRHVVEIIVTSLLIPPLSIYWRIFGALKFRVFFF
ncbi:MAG TPA: glycosyltransferase [Ktedonobacteraceae bacterium]|nr:glycosyltransferase [Ktedonobacteraceae bacterium]